MHKSSNAPRPECEGRVDFDRVVAASAQPVDVVITEVRHQGLQLGRPVEEVTAVEGAVVGAEGLELAVHRLRKSTRDGVAVVTGQQHVPLGTHEHFST